MRRVAGAHGMADAVTESLALKRHTHARAGRGTTDIRLERVR